MVSGESKNLSLAIDTGSDDVIIAPGFYQPSSESISLRKAHPDNPELNHTAWTTLYQTKKNSCGILSVAWNGFKDTMTFQGITVKDQKVAASVNVDLDRPDVVSTLPPRKFVHPQFQSKR